MNELKSLTVRMPTKVHRDLRKLSYLTEIPIAVLIRNGIEIILNNNKKVLTNSDVVVS